MSISYLENNSIRLVGKVTSEKEFSHEVYKENFYSFNLEVERLSGATDVLPVIISEKLLQNFDLKIGLEVRVLGQFRSYNNTTENKGRTRLVLSVFVKEIEKIEDVAVVSGEETDEEDSHLAGIFESTKNITNDVNLTGFICKKPVYRKTPFGREITDVLLAVNRAYNKSDYIPCIAWGRNAKYAETLSVGCEIRVTGRVQSRIYEKRNPDDTVTTRVAYEVSLASLDVVEEDSVADEKESKITA
jgi:single-stranded DNA-binding protein